MTTAKGPVLVLGATGQVGQLLRALWPQTQAVIWQSRQPHAGFDQCDLLASADQLVDLMQGCCSVLCLAGVTDAYHNRTGAPFSDNSRLAQATIVAAHNAGCPQVVLCSSAAVYGAANGRHAETETGVGLSEYGMAKSDMEDVARALAGATGVNVCSLRIGNIAGVDAILGGWKPGFELDCFADGRTPERSYIGPRTFARLLLQLLQTEDLPPVLNVSQPDPVQMGDLLNAAGLAWQARPAPPSTIASVHLCEALLEKTLGAEVAPANAASLIAEWQDTLQKKEAAR